MRRLILILGLLTAPAWGATYYLLAGSAGTCTVGVTNNFSTACNKIPNNLAAGDTVVLGNDGGNFATNEASHIFFGDGTSVSHIKVRFASASLDSGVTGWNASYATAPAKWSNAQVAGALTASFWTVCASYYDFDGLVGTPYTAGTYGFLFQSQARMFGFISVDEAKCTGGNTTHSITNVTFNHIEVDGVSPDKSTLLGIGTVAVTGSNVAWVSGSTFTTGASWTSLRMALGRNSTTYAISSVTDANNLVITGSPGNGTYVYSVAQGAARGWYLGSSLATDTTTNLQHTNTYTHDVAVPFQLLANITGWTFTNNKVARNFSDTAQHANGIQVQISGGATGLVNFVDHNNIWEDIVGTGVEICLNGACSNWQTYDNLYYYSATFGNDAVFSSGTFPGCSYGDIVASCDVSKLWGDNNNSGSGVLSSSSFYGNSIGSITQPITANFPIFGGTAQSGIVLSSVGSTGNTVKNNVWYNSSLVGMPTSTFGTHGNNSCYSCTFNLDGAAATDKTYPGVNPFTSSTFSGASSMALTAVTDAGDNTLGAPFNVDYLGVSRGTACNSGWCRGALEFAVVAASYTVTASCNGNANGTIIGSAGSVMNAVCTAGVCSGTCSESITAGNSGTYTGAATTGSMISFSIGACVTSPCTVTVNSPLTVAATLQANVTCTLTCVSNNINSPATVSCTAALTGLSSNYLWELTEPINGYVIAACNTDGCKTGATGNLQYTGSGIYTLIATGNGVFCTASTQPLNINTGAGSAAH